MTDFIHENNDKYLKTTEIDFDIFKDECEKWIKIFGLSGWYVSYRHEPMDKTYSANICYCFSSRTATIKLNTFRLEHECTELSLRKSAFHEVCELFLGKITCLAESRYLSAGQIEEETHNIIRTLEREFFLLEYCSAASDSSDF